MACLLLSPLLQFGNSGGPLVNLVSSACTLSGQGREVPCACWSVPPGARCPSVGALVGATAAGREGLCIHQAPCEEEQGISPVWEPCAASEPMGLWRGGAETYPGEAGMADAGRAEGGSAWAAAWDQPQQGRAGCRRSRLGRDGRTGRAPGLHSSSPPLHSDAGWIAQCPFPCRMAK